MNGSDMHMRKNWRGQTGEDPVPLRKHISESLFYEINFIFNFYF
jgi:hypothetical protein